MQDVKENWKSASHDDHMDDEDGIGSSWDKGKNTADESGDVNDGYRSSSTIAVTNTITTETLQSKIPRTSLKTIQTVNRHQIIENF